MPVLRPWNDPRSRTRPVTSSGGRPVWFAIVNAIAMSSQLRTASTQSFARAAEPRGRVRNERRSHRTNAAFVSTIAQPTAPANRGAEPVPGAPRRGEAAPTRANQRDRWRAPAPALERCLDVGARDADVVVDVERRLGAEAIGPEAVVQTV